MSLQGLRKELQTLRKEIAPGYKSIEELLKFSKNDMDKLTDYELYRLIRYDPHLIAEPELTENNFKNLSDEELLKIIGEYDEPAAN